MKTKLLLSWILCWVSLVGISQQAGSDNYKLIQYDFTGGIPDQEGPPASPAFILQQSATGGISAQMQSSDQFILYPGLVIPGYESGFAGWVSGIWGPDEVIDVNGDLTIPISDTLMIKHNVQVVFHGPYSLSVHGTLLAYGTETDSIVFSPSITNPNGWKGIRFIQTTPNSQGTSELHYCCFIDGYNNDPFLDKKGGALYVFESDSLIIENCLFKDNYAGFSGGAAYFEKSDVKVIHSVFDHNVCNNLGGGVFIYDCDPLFENVGFKGNDATEGGGVYIDASGPEMHKCVLSGNYAVNFGGGIFFKDAYPGDLEYCEISFNNTDNFGGGIYCENTSLQFRHFTITGNTAFNEGEGIYAKENSSVYLNHCILYGNGNQEYKVASGSTISADYCDIKNGGISGTGNIDTDPLYVDPAGGDLRLSWTGFPYFDGTKSPCIDAGDHHEPRDNDGTFPDLGAYMFDQSTHTVLGGVVSGIWTKAGSPYLITDETNIPVDSTLIIEPGVEIYFLEHYPFLVYGQIMVQGIDTDSVLFSVQDTAGFYSDTHYGWQGLRFMDGNTTGQQMSLIAFTKFEFGKANPPDLHGGAVYCNNMSAVEISNCLFENNKACGGNGGAVSCHNNACIEINASTFKNNSTTASGGALRIENSTPVFNNLTIAFNSADWGGGIAAYNNADVIIRRCLVFGNSSNNTGGGFHTYTSHPVIINSDFYGNSTPFEGGGLYVGVDGVADVVNSIFRNNTSDQIYEYPGASVSATYSNIEGGWPGTGNIDSDPLFLDPVSHDFSLTWMNYPYHDTTRSPCINAGDPATQKDPDGTTADMGALYFNMSDCGEVSGIWSLMNSPVMLGGKACIPIGTTLTVEPGVEVIFTENWPIMVYGQILAEGTEADSIFFTAQDETTGWNGIRFFNTNINGQDSSRMKYCRFEFGNATFDTLPKQRGGAMCFHLSSNIYVDNCLFVNNTAYFGGAIFCGESAPKFSNIIVENNTACYGGGINSTYSDAVYENVIIRNNYGEIGGGFFIYAGAPQISWSVICYNDAAIRGGGIAADSSAMVDISHSLIYKNTAVRGGALWCNNYSSPSIDHVTFVLNEAIIGGGTLFNDTLSAVSFTNCILWDNSPQEISMSSGSITATWSDIENGTGEIWFNEGCIDSDPFFKNSVSDEYSLRWDDYPLPNSSQSPCIDAGNPLYSVDPDGTLTDMGAVCFEQWGKPVITNITDVPNDQGKKVVINWNRSSIDHPDSLQILSYSIWREQDWAEVPWEFMGEIPAMFFDEYAFIAPTVSDSNETGIPWFTFKVIAETSNPFIFYPSIPDSGYSVDNIAPQAPENLEGIYTGIAIELNWSPVQAEDFQYYAIYKSPENGIFPSEPYSFSIVPSYTDSVVSSDTLFYFVTAFDFTGNESLPSNIVMIEIDTGILLGLVLVLEGPFNGTEMNTDIFGTLPLSQPYNTAPWNYTGTETVTAIPNTDVVDWILVELRDAPDASSADTTTIVARQAAFLLKNGSVVAMDGQLVLQFSGLIVQQSLFAVIWHRNHLGIMSSGPLTETGGVYTYDFSTGMGQAYGGFLAHKELAPGIWGMTGADGNADQQINNTDKIEVWGPQAGSGGYKSGDYNMNGEVNNGDKNDVWAPNTGLGGQVPD